MGESCLRTSWVWEWVLYASTLRSAPLLGDAVDRGAVPRLPRPWPALHQEVCEIFCVSLGVARHVSGDDLVFHIAAFAATALAAGAFDAAAAVVAVVAVTVLIPGLLSALHGRRPRHPVRPPK